MENLKDRYKERQEEVGKWNVTQVMISKPAQPSESPGDILHFLVPWVEWELLVHINIRDRSADTCQYEQEMPLDIIKIRLETFLYKN